MRHDPAHHAGSARWTGRQWRTPLAVADVTRLQSVLDAIDSQLVAANPAKTASTPMLRLLTAILLIVAAVSGQLAVAFTLLLALIEPTVAFFAAGSVAAAAAAVIAWRDRLSDLSLPMTSVAVLLVIAAVLGAAAWIVRKGSDQPRIPKLAGALALGGTISWLLVCVTGVDLVRLHHGIRAWPSAAILPMALAVVLLWESNRLARRASLLSALIGVMAAFGGSTMFLDRFSTDPLLASGPSITVRQISGPPLLEFPVPVAANALKLGPGGRFVAIVSENNDEQSVFHVGPTGGPLIAFEADEGVFVGDRHMLLVAGNRSGTIVRDLELANPSAVVREQRIASLASGRLSVDTVSGRWSVIGSGDHDDVVNVEGVVGSDRVVEHRWKLPPTAGGYLVPLAAAGDAVIAVETRYGRSLFSGGSFWRWAPLLSAADALAESRILAFGPGTSVEVMNSQFAIRCEGVSVGRRGAGMLGVRRYKNAVRHGRFGDPPSQDAGRAAGRLRLLRPLITVVDVGLVGLSSVSGQVGERRSSPDPAGRPSRRHVADRRRRLPVPSSTTTPAPGSAVSLSGQ